MRYSLKWIGIDSKATRNMEGISFDTSQNLAGVALVAVADIEFFKALNAKHLR